MQGRASRSLWSIGEEFFKFTSIGHMSGVEAFLFQVTEEPLNSSTLVIEF